MIRKSKVIKKLYKAAAIIALIILALPTGAFILVQLPAVQTHLTRQIAKQVSRNLNAKFEVGRVDIVFFNRLLLRDIYIEDQKGDTLMKAARLSATVQQLNRTKRSIVFNQIMLHDAEINLRSDADSVLNLQFIIDAVGSEDTAKTRWDIAINAVNFTNSKLSFRRHEPEIREYGINFQDIELSRFNLLANKIHTTADSVHFNIMYLNFTEKSGFRLDHFTSENSISSSGIDVRNLKILTPGSRLDLDHYNMNFKGFEAFRDFVSRVAINSSFNHSVIRFKDISYFAKGLKDFDQEVTMSGEVTGRIDNLKGSGIHITGFQETSLVADFNMIGLPDFDETFIFLDLENLTSSAGDILKIVRSGPDGPEENLQASLSALGELSYKGKFTGFIDDFVAYGQLTTGLGTLITDISLQPDADNILNFNGRLNAVHFDAGSLAASDQIGRITFSAGINGQISTHSGIYANLDGIIDSVQLFDYTYRYVQLEGELNERNFRGSAYINDPNLVLEFLGTINLTEEIPEFDFTANVSGARLYDLKLQKEDPDLMVSFFSTANFEGNNIDNLNGRISLVNAVFKSRDQILEVDNVSLEATGAESTRNIILSSNLADARISGNYEFATIARSYSQFVNHFIPSYAIESSQYPEPTGNSFTFEVQIKDIEEFTEFFTPELYIASGTYIRGIYDPSSFISEITGFTEKLQINRNTFHNLNLDTSSGDTVFQINSSADRIILASRYELENISLTSGILNDSIGIKLGWDNKDKLTYKGSLMASVNFEKNPGKKMPLAFIDLYPSSIIIADSLWQVSKSRMRIDTTSFEIENFVFGMDGQSFQLDGKISEAPCDSLHFVFKNLDLQNIELITSLANFHAGGIVNGYASLSDLYENPVFKTDLGIDELTMNNQDFGNMSILSEWDNTTRSINIHTFSNRGDDRIINIEGRYIPDGGMLDFKLQLNKINLRTLDGYLDEVFANLRGIATGELKLEGNIRQPLVNGNLLLQKTSFTVDYLNTQYNFTHEVKISNNEIIFDDLVIYDINHNTCRANGRITSNYFRDFALNINLYPERFMALNTLEKDNDLFYGRVFASGVVNITGPTDNITINIAARTNRNTRFFIPLQKSSELRDLHFLNFTGGSSIETDQAQETETRRYEVDLTGIELNFDLDVTPDAEVQIIFDSTIGDIIRGRGSGSFKIGINSLGQFNMFGEYIIDRGDYLFTLQNVINKRFDIERGGRISWSGNPADANVDLKAVYRVRASLRPILGDLGSAVASDFRRPVECHIILRNKLMSPDIRFEIELPSADQEIRSYVEASLNTEEKRNRQFLALLVLSSFLPDQGSAGPDRASSLGTSATEAGINTVSEFFSNQLSNWLSQVSRDVNFGVNWRPGDEITPDEVELALSTQLLNDRISINGHVDVAGRQTNTSNIVGDFDVDIKLNRSGKLRLKAFTRANDNLIRPHLSPYTQGVGLFYREEFDSFEELMNRYWNRVFSNNNREEE